MKIFFLASIFVLVFLISKSEGKPKPSKPIDSCNCVAFRLDDIQNGWLVKSQKAVIEVFKENKDPLSVGIIANKFDSDQSIVGYIKSQLQVPDWEFEVVNHGWNHEFFDTFTLQEQTKFLADSKEKTMRVLSPHLEELDVFIAPFNAINADTLTALKATGYNVLSSMVEIDFGPYPRKDADLYHWPMEASTDDKYTGYVAQVYWQLTYSQILSQLENYGFAVVMMHPQEFSNLINNIPQESVNTSYIAELRQLISAVKARGIEITTLGGIKDKFAEAAASSSSSSTPSISTTGITSSEPISTGVTTKKIRVTTGTTTQSITTGQITTDDITTDLVTTALSTGSITTESEVTTDTSLIVDVSTGIVTTSQTVITTGKAGGSPGENDITSAQTLTTEDELKSSDAKVLLSCVSFVIGVSLFML